MPHIHILTADAALGEALDEQLRLIDLGTVNLATSLAQILSDGETQAMIIDEKQLQKKNLSLLMEDADKGNKKRVFTVGDVPQDWKDIVTESFSKPLRLGHIISRLQFFLKTVSRVNSVPQHFGQYRFEPQNRQVVIEETGDVIRLTEKETALLEQLASADDALTREELLASIWGYGAGIDTHTLETHIYQLRRKLDPKETGSNWLINEQGAYRLNRDRQTS